MKRNHSGLPVHGMEKLVEESKRRLNQKMSARGKVDDVIARLTIEMQQAHQRRDELNKEIGEEREFLEKCGEGVSFEQLPNEILTRIISELGLEDRMNIRVNRRMIEVERMTKKSTQSRICHGLTIEVERANLLSISQSDFSSAKALTDIIPIAYTRLSGLSVDSGMEVLRIMEMTRTITQLEMQKMNLLSKRNRERIFEAATRIARTGEASVDVSRGIRAATPLSFSLLRPTIEQAQGRVEIRCSLNVTSEDLQLVHEMVTRNNPMEFVFLGFVNVDVAEQYREHLKENLEPTDMMFTGRNQDESRNGRPEWCHVRKCEERGYYDMGKYSEEDIYDHIVTSIVYCNSTRPGRPSTFRIIFQMRSSYYIQMLAGTHRRV